MEHKFKVFLQYNVILKSYLDVNFFSINSKKTKTKHLSMYGNTEKSTLSAKNGTATDTSLIRNRHNLQPLVEVLKLYAVML